MTDIVERLRSLGDYAGVHGKAIGNEAADEIERLRAALERIHGMAERPKCICGRPTGTAAIKQCAREALK